MLFTMKDNSYFNAKSYSAFDSLPNTVDLRLSILIYTFKWNEVLYKNKNITEYWNMFERWKQTNYDILIKRFKI